MYHKLFDICLPTVSILRSELATQDDLPESVTTSFGYDSEFPDVLIQEINQEVLNYVDKVYILDTGTDAINQGAHGSRITEYYLNSLNDYTKDLDKDAKLLELGCGQGLILQAISAQGFTDLTGLDMVDPADIVDLESITIRAEYIHETKFEDEAFDFIFSKTTLEHIPDIKKTFTEINRILKTGGGMFFTVPNCKREIEIGDQRMLSLTHWNYFTEDNIKGILERFGFTDINIQSSPTGQDIHAYAVKSGKPSDLDFSSDSADITIDSFNEKLQKNLKYLQNRKDDASKANKTIGIWGLDYNLVSILDWKNLKPRMIDSDKQKWGFYYAMEENAVVEDPNSLLETPVDELWVAPIFYDQEIRKYIAEELKIGADTKVISLMEAFSSNQK